MTTGRVEHISAPVSRLLVELVIRSAVAAETTVEAYSARVAAAWDGDPQGLEGFRALAQRAAKAVAP